MGASGGGGGDKLYVHAVHFDVDICFKPRFIYILKNNKEICTGSEVGWGKHWRKAFRFSKLQRITIAGSVCS